MKSLTLLTIAVTTILTFSGVAYSKGGHNDNRKGYQQHHYSPRSYRSHDRTIYRRGYQSPPRGYYPYSNRPRGQRTIYFNFFGFPIVTY